MSKRSVLISVAVVAVGGSVAFGQQVVSFNATGVGGEFIIVPEVPAGGLVVTDLIAGVGRDADASVDEAILPGDPIETILDFAGSTFTSYNL